MTFPATAPRKGIILFCIRWTGIVGRHIFMFISGTSKRKYPISRSGIVPTLSHHMCFRPECCTPLWQAEGVDGALRVCMWVCEFASVHDRRVFCTQKRWQRPVLCKCVPVCFWAKLNSHLNVMFRTNNAHAFGRALNFYVSVKAESNFVFVFVRLCGAWQFSHCDLRIACFACA